MVRYVTWRLLTFLYVLLGVSLAIFVLMRLIPGDPALVMLGERATAERIVEVRRSLGLDRSLAVQYLIYLKNILTGHLGRSIHTNTRVAEELSERFPATIELSLAAICLAGFIGVLAGIVSATRQYSILDSGFMMLSLAGVSMPIFWLGLMMIWAFALVLGWFPPSGRLEVRIFLDSVTGFYVLDSLLTRNWEAFWDALWHLALPAITLATVPFAIIARMTRSSLLEVLRQEYITTARSKGLNEWVVITRHALRNALIPILTVGGLQFGLLLGGAILTETIFSWPGLGRLLYNAVLARDYPVVQGGTLLIAVTFTVINLVVDLLYALADPRIRYE
ncbi:MAG TPA: ABC transporter permease [Candidatus Tectomicrobia bacterium]|nr:ABC transporter permease [Candidatus Tectomicrobia bacterium]